MTGAPDAPVFREPWEAQAFAMALTLHERGVFTWTEWGGELATQIAAAQAAGDPDDGDTYYQHWLATLEALVAHHDVASPDELGRYRSGWERAAERTPHGQPIELRSTDIDPEPLP